MPDPVTDNYSFILPTVGGDTNTWGGILNSGAMTAMDQVLAGVFNVIITTTDVTLSAAQFQNATFNVTGALTGNRSLIMPLSPNSATLACAGRFIVVNNTTGNFNLTVKTAAAGSTGVVIPQGFAAFLYSDGTNVNFANVGLSAYAKAVNGNPNGQLAGTAGSVNTNASIAWDYANNLLYVCITSGNAATAVWSVTILPQWTTATRPATPTDGQLGYNTNLKLYEFWNSNTSAWTQLVTTWPASSVSGLVVTQNSGTPTQISVTATEAVLVDTSGGLTALKRQNISFTIDSTVTGVNGCDVGTRAANTSYDIYMITNGVTWGGLLVIEGNSPVYPAGYSFSKKISWEHTDGSSNFRPMIQKGNIGQYTSAVINFTSGASLIGIVPNAAFGVLVIVNWGNAAVYSLSVDGIQVGQFAAGAGAGSGSFQGSAPYWCYPSADTKITFSNVASVSVKGWQLNL